MKINLGRIKMKVSICKIGCLVVCLSLLVSCNMFNNEHKEGNKEGVYYEVFVRSFADSDGDGIGDFNGLTAKLDYLNDGDKKTDTDLGVDGIWLMPINVSPSYHQYDVADYYNIDEDYGTIEDFEKFLKEAHKRGIKVIMDLVVNHTSNQHPWFQEALRSKDSQYRDYYHILDEYKEGYNLEAVKFDHPVWNKEGDCLYNGIFGYNMPDLNYDNPKVRDEMNKIAQFWLKKGIDGFRLDAARHIYDVDEYPLYEDLLEKNILWWQEFCQACEEINPNVYLVGEVWDNDVANVAPYCQVFDSCFNFGAGETIMTMVSSKEDSGFGKQLENIYKCYGESNNKFIDAPFLSNHDKERVMSTFKGDKKSAKLAANIYLTLPGNPFIYYGEEIGMKGEKPDEKIREPLKWFKELKEPQTKWEVIEFNKDISIEEQMEQPDSLLTYYKALIRVRQSSEALVSGDFITIETNNNKALVYQRKTDKQEAIVIHNLNEKEEIIKLEGIDVNNYKVHYESTGEGKNTITNQQLKIAPQTTVILTKSIH